MDRLSERHFALGNLQAIKRKPSSFGAYLGSFRTPVTELQYRVLNQWDLIIVNPFQPGVIDAVSKFGTKPVLGRVDLDLIIFRGHSTLAGIEKLEDILFGAFYGRSFSGILFSNWECKFPRAVWIRLLEIIEGFGLAIYLETWPPNFLKDNGQLRTNAISGLVIRNASILPNGEKRDYFEMADMQSTIKAFVSEACTRDFVVMIWETVDDNAVVSNAVIRRSLQWCSFYSALCWTCRHSALYDTTLSTKTIEPLSAFGWLKHADTMAAHTYWRLNTDIKRDFVDIPGWNTLRGYFPSLDAILRSASSQVEVMDDQSITVRDPSNWSTVMSSHDSPLSVSFTEQSYDSCGCIPLGIDVAPVVFAEILQSQLQLKSLGLSDSVSVSKVQSIGILLRQFCDHWAVNSGPVKSIQELAELAIDGSLCINLGMDSGFRKDTDSRLWAVYQIDSAGIEIFVSKDAQDLEGTVLHTFLSAKGHSRQICFEAETALGNWLDNLVGNTGLPRRIVQDIDALSPEEQLLLLQHLTVTYSTDGISEAICTYIRKQLVDAPSFVQLKELSTIGFLSGSVSPETLVRTRVNWYKELQCQYPSTSTCLALFNEVDVTFTRILSERREQDLAHITSSLCDIIKDHNIDPYTDITALSLFCAARKCAFDEIYTEVTDRNPLFGIQNDQAAAFAEAFALGSRCEAYFDVSPSVFGKLLSDRFRCQYSTRELPDWVNGAPQVATAYAGAQTDVDQVYCVRPMSPYQRFTFLSAFAVPALIDILLLTIIGRGLYLSTFMTYDQQQSATLAVMISLLLSGAIGSWIACGGPYYLASMAFAAANMFILTRLIAGIAFTIATGLVAFIAISAGRGAAAGIIFYLYLVALTTYFSVFASLASFSYPKSSFLSGRKIIFYCVPILFISPIITTFTGHDVAIYLAVLYAFLGCLLLGLRAVASKWVTWYQRIRRTDDTEIRMWYISTYKNNDEKALDGLSDPAVLKVARDTLLRDVFAERERRSSSRAKRSGLVFELARDWESTNFLLDWYCRYADVPRPIAFSSSWNIQLNVALDTLRNSQKGLRLHNAFIHWRQSGKEIGCGVLYFVIALLDKWVELLTGGHLVGLSTSLRNTSRMAIGFGLAYYLVGAVLIDIKAQDLEDLLGKQTPMAVRTAQDARISQKRYTRFKIAVYWRTLFKFLMWHTWSLAISTSLVWTFQDSLEATITFLLYVLAYTGLLWYQYTKIFSGPYALKPLLAGVVVGLPIGIALKQCLPSFQYPQVIGLAAATWTVALLSLSTAKLGMPRRINSLETPSVSFHAYTTPWDDPDWSHEELNSLWQKSLQISPHSRLKLAPKAHPGFEVKDIMNSRIEKPKTEEAFPNVDELVRVAIDGWEEGIIMIELVPSGSLGPGIQALSCHNANQLHLVISVGRGLKKHIDVHANCQIIAETLLHAVSEAFMGMPHEHAVLTGSLVTDGMAETTRQQLHEESNTATVTRWARKELLRQLCLGFDCDTQWEQLPKQIRIMLLDRCLGRPGRLSVDQAEWLQERLCLSDAKTLDVHVARCNLGVATMARILGYPHHGTGGALVKEPERVAYIPRPPLTISSIVRLLKAPFSYFYHALGSLSKFVIVALVADAEFQRELDHVMKNHTVVYRVPVKLTLNLIWCYAKIVQETFMVFFLFHGRDDVKRLWNETKGLTIGIKKASVMIQGLDGTFTAFWHAGEDNCFKVSYYTGEHKTEPDDSTLLKYVCTYSNDLLLNIRQELSYGQLVNEYHYDYFIPRRTSRLKKSFAAKIPLSRRCVNGEHASQRAQYNRNGLISSGSYMRNGSLVRFQYRYRKNPHFGDELLSAEFSFPHTRCSISWCAPPLRRSEKANRWIPHAKVTRATFVQGSDVYESRWLYDHKFNPAIFTTLNGENVKTPAFIEYDHLGILTKPKHTSFVRDNPLLYCDSLTTNIFQRFLGLTTRRFPVSTSRARSLMWKAWKDHVDFDGVTVRWMDDRLLRRDRTLAPYWRRRDHGELVSAETYLTQHADTIMASADLNDNVSSWTPLAVKISDLFNFGPGGDAVINTRTKDFGSDTENTLHVMAADTGTWPNEGGGVSACRRDMVNHLRTVKWHMICESANDFGIPKHQTEHNVQSLKIIPLWGLDFLTPTHGLLRNKLDSEVDDKTSANEFDIKQNFVPILATLVKSSRAVNLTRADIRQSTRALVNLNTYFQGSRHWTQVWNSDIVKKSWGELWLSQTMPNAIPTSSWFQTELPTLASLDIALELWYRYLFIFSIPVPEKVPDVFQASHHSVSASYGVVCKMKRGCTLQIWDHAISWREVNISLSSALSKLSPFIRNALLGLMRITSVLTLHHADIITPCTDFFNPDWEVEIGTVQGTIQHRNIFRRKVDPVVNGIINMQKFAPVKEIKSQHPTVTMLSHVWYAKDIKTALLAADIIINHWHFTNYNLEIYGAIDRSPMYTTECQEIIASKSLRGKVTLCGTADPLDVLERTWLFLNSSLSEGLPLALGEAALTGAPVVCTDVGASLRVLSDPDDSSRYSAVVAPNDALALARAQISMLAMLGEWSQYADDPDDMPAPVLTSNPSREDVERITHRMYEKTPQRRKLGMMTRGIVQKSFGGERCLREHEQMLWVGKAMKVMRSRSRNEIEEWEEVDNGGSGGDGWESPPVASGNGR